MSTITVRLFHHPSGIPIAELQGVDPGATLSSLRAMAERHLAAEEACMMRVFARWHVEAVFGGRKRMIELTDEDSGSSLSSLGIEDYSAVLLEGPLTHTVEGVGQGLALVAAQVREQNSQLMAVMLRIADSLTRVESNTFSMRADILENLVIIRRNEYLSSFPHIEHTYRLALAAEERNAFSMLPLQSASEEGSLSISGEEALARSELLTAANLEYQRFLRFAIDSTTPRDTCVIENQFTAVKTSDGGNVTFRALQPLTAANHRWAVKIHDVGSYTSIGLGLLPKLSADMEAKMGSSAIANLGGWGIYRHGMFSSVRGNWQCEKLPFGSRGLVLFDYSFADKTLNIRYGDNEVVGHIPDAGEELYPAFTVSQTFAKVSFETYP